MAQKTITPGFRTFLLIWFGQLISLTGTGLTGSGPALAHGYTNERALLPYLPSLHWLPPCQEFCSPPSLVRWWTAGIDAGRCF